MWALIDYENSTALEWNMAKKLKNERALLKEALELIMADAVKRGIVEFYAADSHDLKS